MIDIKGKAEKCSKEFIRGWCWASIAVLSFHNRFLAEPITVRIVPPSHKKMQHNPLTGGRNAGVWSPSRRTIYLRADQKPESMGTIILHEFIHALCGSFENGSDERCCSTLTAKLKPEVAKIAQPLIDNVYQRAAVIAHTKISYRSKEGQDDGYNPDQWIKVGTVDSQKRGK